MKRRAGIVKADNKLRCLPAEGSSGLLYGFESDEICRRIFVSISFFGSGEDGENAVFSIGPALSIRLIEKKSY